MAGEALQPRRCNDIEGESLIAWGKRRLEEPLLPKLFPLMEWFLGRLAPPASETGCTAFHWDRSEWGGANCCHR
jgi:hypothetical protein